MRGARVGMITRVQTLVNGGSDVAKVAAKFTRYFCKSVRSVLSNGQTNERRAQYIRLVKDDKRTHALNARMEGCNDEIFMNLALL